MNVSNNSTIVHLSDTESVSSSANDRLIRVFEKRTDKDTEEKIKCLRREQEMKKNIFRTIISSSPAPDFDPEETPQPLTCFWTSCFEGQFMLERRADRNVCLYRQRLGDTDGDGEIIRGVGERIIISRSGRILVREDINLCEENQLFFGVPISCNPDKPYENTSEQINVHRKGSPDPSCYHLYEGVVIPDTMNPTLGPYADVTHFGTVPHSILREQNSHFVRYCIRNMHTQEIKHFFIESSSEDDEVIFAPMSLDGEVYFLLKTRIVSHVIHARSGKVVFTINSTNCDVVSASDYIAVGSSDRGFYTVMFLSRFPQD